MSRVAALAKMIKPMATIQSTTIELAEEAAPTVILQALHLRQALRPALENTVRDGDDHERQPSLECSFINQYFSATNFRPASDAWSS